MWSAILKLLKAEWASLLVIMVLTCGGMWLGTKITSHQLSEQKAGYEKELREQSAGFDAQKLQWQVERTAAASRNAAQLQEALKKRDALQAKADDLTRQLAVSAGEHQRKVNDLNRRLNDALKHDGSGFTGLGPAGLQLWREALGYPAAGTISVAAGDSLPASSGSAAADTADASRAGGGLSPAGIVSQSAEYGKWCLQLRDKLQGIGSFYATGSAQP